MFKQETWKKLKRGPQIITLKDAGLISAFTGLQSGDTAVDAGAGSGFLATYLGSVVAPGGKVVSYESRKEFAEIARRNVERAELQKTVEIREKDVLNGIEEREVDLITLDMPDSEKLLENAKNTLKENGFIVGYFPNVEQVKKFVEKAEELKLKHTRTIEGTIREWLIRSYGCRPDNTGITFTGFLVFLRKIPEHEFERERKEEEMTKAGRRSARVKRQLK